MERQSWGAGKTTHKKRPPGSQMSVWNRCVHLGAGRGYLQWGWVGGWGEADGAARRQAERRAFKAGYCLIRCCPGITTACLSLWEASSPGRLHGSACQESKKPQQEEKENGARDYSPERLSPPKTAAYCEFKDKSLTRALCPPRKVGLNQRDWESLWRDLRFCDLGLTPSSYLKPGGRDRD